MPAPSDSQRAGVLNLLRMVIECKIEIAALHLLLTKEIPVARIDQARLAASTQYKTELELLEKLEQMAGVADRKTLAQMLESFEGSPQ